MNSVWISFCFSIMLLNNLKILGADGLRTSYLLYDVNYGEGFNLRRDVYIRFANLVRFLNLYQSQTKWTLVLPPWGQLYHWFNNRSLGQLPWSTFFDLPSLNLFVPVLEFDQFQAETNRSPISKVYYMESLPFTDGKWLERVEPRPCKGRHSYYYSSTHQHWFGWMYGYGERQPISEFSCLGVQAEAKTLVDFVVSLGPVRSVMFDRGESVIHGSYSEWSPEWWTARRSMVFSKRLRKLAAEFRQQYLSSTDVADGTVRPADWRRLRAAEGSAIGGPYLAAHLRRLDFLRAHPDATPSIGSAASQLIRLSRSLGLSTVFLATDDPEAESQLTEQLLKAGAADIRLVRFANSAAAESLTDGELAILDQIVGSHARHFVGSRASTFTYRLVEERSLLGFARSSSIGVFCKGVEDDCEPGTYWAPQYEPRFTLTGENSREEL
ncbi:hypothetical protein BOX15_Mlig023470g3 [Macrostomum lignano]|uniref:GDP-fucose protein O-fucosyltransferase 2 n=1 Tax=Macrostomum lignano TaxID=282301 RepID=A0A267G2S8_9PLAT|nr:hypothetical protein BOX15_Mlig023470g3 [Macrostomum lignano]